MISVIGKYRIKLPTNPGQKTIGKNAAKVVAVEAIIGRATSPVPLLAASMLLYPFCLNRYTFSTTTIALSTNIPRARINENKTTVFRVYPTKFIIRIPINIESGIAIPTNMAFRNPKKNNKINTTKITPEMILFSKLETISLVCTD